MINRHVKIANACQFGVNCMLGDQTQILQYILCCDVILLHTRFNSSETIIHYAFFALSLLFCNIASRLISIAKSGLKANAY